MVHNLMERLTRGRPGLSFRPTARCLGLATLIRERRETPIGSLQCLRDTVAAFRFAEQLPGMPVAFTNHLDGKLVSRVTMISNEVEVLPEEVADRSEGELSNRVPERRCRRAAWRGPRTRVPHPAIRNPG